MSGKITCADARPPRKKPTTAASDERRSVDSPEIA
jgi:hypothetical protein